MKSLFSSFLFAFYFVIKLAGTKVVPIVKHHHLAGLKTRLAMAARFRPQLVRKSQYTLLIGILFCVLGWKQSVLFLSDTLCSSKGKKVLCRIRIHWSNPCRFNSCRPCQMKTKVSGELEAFVISYSLI